ncbi:MAG TPA: chemotaxis protein CheW [Chiayiivirga sp.]|nr:chemotaxis protein CheW [Chiayiivirga sp.]
MSTAVSSDIRGVLINVTGSRALLPNATVAEVITYSPPDALPDAPAWMLGYIRWRGWRLPVVSYARMIGSASAEGEFGAKVVVLKFLGGNPRYSYFAMLAQGFPRLVTVSEQALIEDVSVLDDDDPTPLPEGVLMKVYLNDDAAVIPDLAAIEQKVAALAALQAA